MTSQKTPLYRELDDGRYACYDPASGRYLIVERQDVPPLVPADPVRLGMATPAAAAAAPINKKTRKAQLAIMMAMLKFQERAHEAGDPESATPYLEELNKLLKDPKSLQSVVMRLSWRAEESKSGRVKAVGEGQHAGRVRYGKAAEAALRYQNRLGNKEATPTPHPKFTQWETAGRRAREILDKFTSREHTQEDLDELVTHLPYLPQDRLSTAKSILGAKYSKVRGREKHIGAIMDHVRTIVDGPGRAYGGGSGGPSTAPDAAGAPPAAEGANVPGYGKDGNLFDRSQFDSDTRSPAIQHLHTLIGHGRKHNPDLDVPAGRTAEHVKKLNEKADEFEDAADNHDKHAEYHDLAANQATAAGGKAKKSPAVHKTEADRHRDLAKWSRKKAAENRETAKQLAANPVEPDAVDYLDKLQGLDAHAAHKLGEDHDEDNSTFGKMRGEYAAAHEELDDESSSYSPDEVMGAARHGMMEADRERRSLAHALKAHGHEDLADLYGKLAGPTSKHLLDELQTKADVKKIAIANPDVPKEALPKKPLFTGETVDSLGRHYHWKDGVRIPGPEEQNLDTTGANGTVEAPQQGAGDANLDATSAGGNPSGVQTGVGVGDAVEGQRDPSQAGTGDGTGDGVPGVPAGESGGSGAPVQPSDGTGDPAGGRKGTRAGRSVPGRRKRVGGPARDAEGRRLGGGLDGTEPALPDPTPTEQVVSEPPTPENPTDLAAGNFRYDSRDFFATGKKAKFKANLAAVRTLRDIQADGRTVATPEEQAILSKFTGWGQFPGVFNDFWDKDWQKATGTENMTWEEKQKAQADWAKTQNDWEEERKTLRSMMSDEEWDAAKRSTLNAHYTHPDIVDAHWKMAQRLGFKGGRFLETSAGIGYYLGLMPQELAAKTNTAANELDPTTGAMLDMLYPSANVQITGFQKDGSPDNYYDLVASNVPFGDYKVHDPRYNKHQAVIHDYFFLKSADVVKPGGLVMHITSTGTMDKSNAKIREELAKTCDLVSAIRFPGSAHGDNAGTEVVTDMLILRKRREGEEPGDQSWLKTAMVPDPAGGDPIEVNEYFAKNPDQILGTLDRTGSMYRGDSKNVTRTADYQQRLEAAIAKLPEGILNTKRAPSKAFEPEVLPAPGEAKKGGFHWENGKLYIVNEGPGGGMTEQNLGAAATDRIRGHLAVRDKLRAVLNADTTGADSSAARKELNAVYDDFVKKFGPLNLPANERVFRQDPDSPPLLALENWTAKTKKATKADIFTKATASRIRMPIDKVEHVHEGLGVSLHETGGLDIDRVAQLTGLHRDEVAKQLQEKGLAYEDPSDGWKPADQYLSGNVRKKLAAARAAAATDPRFAHNVKALEGVQPEDVHHDDIEVKCGAPWVPGSDYQNFAAHLLQSQPEAFEMRYIPATGEWHAEYTARAKYLKNSRTATQVWGTEHVGFMDLMDAAMNNQPVTVYYPKANKEDKPQVNIEATEAANGKVKEIKEEFKNWLWTDDERRERLHRHYNDNYNNIRNMKYNGGHQTMPGMNPAITLRDHQKDFIWQVVTTGKGLAGHEVGTGKTYTMIGAAMELRRLGLSKKPAIVCKKANVAAITKDALKAYPHAKILSTADMFDEKNRKKIVSRIATGDYDMVIMTHDHMDLMSMKPETQAKYIQEELAELEAAHAAAFEESKGDKGDRVVKELAKAKEKLEAKLQAALDDTKKDDAINFEDTGIDQLFIDEAHRYKSLPIYTKLRGLKGIPTRASDRATNMLMRSRWLQERNKGRGVVFATGTPVANTMGELYNMQRFLQHKELEDRGIKTFDAWAATFGDVETKQEYTVTGENKNVSRFARFTNVPELMQITREMLDVQRADDMKNDDGSPVIVRPKRNDGVAVAPQSAGIESMMTWLQDRAHKLSGKATKGDDNMLAICTDGRKGSIDLRMIDLKDEEGNEIPSFDDPTSKTNQCVNKVLELHNSKPGKTQMIFSDIGANPMQNGFHLYGDIIEKLVKGGIPRDKIADFTKLDGKKKDEAVEALKRGELVVALGGTETLGTGVNAQDKLYALHHLDCPWRPADLEQREGRAWRHGNENKEIEIHRYVTKGSLDQLFWQGIDRKSRFIKQVMKPGDAKLARHMEDEDTEELSAAQVMAAAAGDPRILQKVQLEADVKDLGNAQKRHEREQVSFKNTLRDHASSIGEIEHRIKDLEETAAHLDKNPDFHASIGVNAWSRQTHTERPAAAEAFDKAVVDSPNNYSVDLGTYRGLPLTKRQGRIYLKTLGGGEVSTGQPSLPSIEYAARNLRSEKATWEGTLAQKHKDLAQIKEKIGLPFKHAETLAQKREELKALEAALAAPKDPPPGTAPPANGPGEQAPAAGYGGDAHWRPEPDAAPAEEPAEPAESTMFDSPAAAAPQVSVPTPYGPRRAINVPHRDMRGNAVAKSVGVQPHHIPGLESLAIGVEDPGGNKAKATKHGHRLYELTTGVRLAQASHPEEPLDDIIARLKRQIAQHGGPEGTMKMAHDFAKRHRDDLAAGTAGPA